MLDRSSGVHQCWYEACAPIEEIVEPVTSASYLCLTARHGTVVEVNEHPAAPSGPVAKPPTVVGLRPPRVAPKLVATAWVLGLSPPRPSPRITPKVMSSLFQAPCRPNGPGTLKNGLTSPVMAPP